MTDRVATVEGGPRLDRSLTLHLQGDWGLANLHRICGWIAAEVGGRSGPETKIAIWNGYAGSDAVHAVAKRDVDAALLVPSVFAKMAVEGRGLFEGDPHPELRALGSLPQRDRLVLAIGAEHGIRSFADLREKKPALRIATSPDDGVNTVGYAAHTVMAAHGIPRADLESWGGSYLEDGLPFPCQAWLLDGSADALLHEAIMTPGWREAAEARDLVFIPMEDAVLSQLERDLGWPRAILPAGYLRGLDRDLVTLDYSDFLLICRDDLPDDLAHLIAWALGETRENLEYQFRHIPPDRSPVTYPLDPVKIGTTPISLHPGAERYYATLDGWRGP